MKAKDLKIEDLLEYNSDTGIVTWKVSTGNSKIGCEAGNIDRYGYKRVQLKGKFYRIHRLAWYLYYGEFPKKLIDHINGDRTDNRVCNLRDVSCRENLSNCKVHRNGKLVGTRLRKNNKTWQSRIRVEGKLIHLGDYDTEIEAHNAYLEKLKELGELRNEIYS